MSLRKEQTDFARLVPRLIDKVFELGMECTLGDTYRDPRVFGPLGVKKGYGHPKSGHKNRLAIDINLFIMGGYVDDEKGHKALGEWWEKQDPRCRWGGRFNDPNHYSFEYEGIK